MNLIITPSLRERCTDRTPQLQELQGKGQGESAFTGSRRYVPHTNVSAAKATTISNTDKNNLPSLVAARTEKRILSGRILRLRRPPRNVQDQGIIPHFLLY